MNLLPELAVTGFREISGFLVKIQQAREADQQCRSPPCLSDRIPNVDALAVPRRANWIIVALALQQHGQQSLCVRVWADLVMT
jgi:hypothetical protein